MVFFAAAAAVVVANGAKECAAHIGSTGKKSNNASKNKNTQQEKTVWMRVISIYIVQS